MSNLSSMSKKYRPYEPNQIMLLPPSLDEWVPQNHIARFIGEVVDSLDLSVITAEYETELRGQPPFNPAMMVKILIYSYASGVYSSRKIAQRCMEDVATRYLAANNFPDFRTIAKFRKRHLASFSSLFAQVLQLCQEAGLVKMGHVALDGTKIKANASKHKAMSYGRMVTEEERLRSEIQTMMQKAATLDNMEDRKYGDRQGNELPDELAFREKRLARIQEAKAALEAKAKARAAAQARTKSGSNSDDDPPPGGKSSGVRRGQQDGVPKAKEQRNFTDPDSRIMRGPEKNFMQAYNAQAAVDADSQVIVAAHVTNQASDSPHLIPMVKQVQRNTTVNPDELSADAGYYSQANVEWLMAKRIDPLIPPGKISHSERRSHKPPRGPLPRKPRERMARKMKLTRNVKRYKKRQQSIEPVFGQIKQGKGFRQFSLRGLGAAQAEWFFVCTVHNLGKLFRALQAV